MLIWRFLELENRSSEGEKRSDEKSWKFTPVQAYKFTVNSSELSFDKLFFHYLNFHFMKKHFSVRFVKKILLRFSLWLHFLIFLTFNCIFAALSLHFATLHKLDWQFSIKCQSFSCLWEIKSYKARLFWADKHLFQYFFLTSNGAVHQLPTRRYHRIQKGSTLCMFCLTCLFCVVVVLPRGLVTARSFPWKNMLESLKSLKRHVSTFSSWYQSIEKNR